MRRERETELENPLNLIAERLLLFIYLKSSKLYKGVLRLKEYVLIIILIRAIIIQNLFQKGIKE